MCLKSDHFALGENMKLFFLLLCVIVLSVSSFYSFFEYIPLSLQNILFIICIVEASYPIYDMIVKALDKMIYASANKPNA